MFLPHRNVESLTLRVYGSLVTREKPADLTILLHAVTVELFCPITPFCLVTQAKLFA